MEKRTKSGMYIEGNAARQFEVMPNREAEAEKKELSRIVKHNRQKALQMSRGYVAYLAVVTVIAATVCMFYLKVHSDISKTSSNIVDLKNSISTLEAQNDAVDYSINSYTDVNTIVRVATEELGMVKASKSQIRFYKSSEREYMKQFTDVPEK